jgi:cellulose synthase/poly-beta-1,6-N-acetylglucosamine synthase-like glycosyltransferase
MTVVLLLSFAVLAFEVLLQCLRMELSYRYLAGTRRAVPVSRSGPPMALIVPVLHEQAIIAASVARFSRLVRSRPWLTVVYATSARERPTSGCPTTEDILLQLCSHEPQIEVVRFPSAGGIMSHQANYAVRVFARGQPQSVFGLFNVDSDPPSESIDAARAWLAVRPRTVFQMYCAYSVAAESSRRTVSPIVEQTALWQCRWSLQFELGRIICHDWIGRAAARWPMLRIVVPFDYVIGHGLFFSRETFDLVDGFPEEELNEDAAVSLSLRARGIRVAPLPFLESAEAAPTVGVYVKQQSSWFKGPLFAFRYGRKALHSTGGPRGGGEASAFDKLDVRLSTLKLFAHACYWALGPPLLLVGFPCAMFLSHSWWAIGPWVLSVYLLTVGLNNRASCLLARLGHVSQRRWGAAAVSAYVLHGVGPALAFIQSSRGANGFAEKYKTPRAGEILS